MAGGLEIDITGFSPKSAYKHIDLEALLQKK